MAEPTTDLLEPILRNCARAAPDPWYPADFVQATGVAHDRLDGQLDRLRLAGLIRLTDWVQGRGQGYTLTPAGAEVVGNPRLLARVAEHGPAAAPSREAGPSPAAASPSTAWDRGEAVRASLLGSAVPRVTYALLFLNIFVFLAGWALAFHNGVPLNAYLLHDSDKVETRQKLNEVLHWTGSVSGLDILRGEWWRLLTACFVHIGAIHLAVNMYGLYVVGPLLERMWGPVRFLVLYLVAGLCGSCVALVTNPAGVAGASGALWGIMASMAAWILLNRRFLPPSLSQTWLRQLAIVFVLNVLITFGVPNISAGAHFGGGAVGLLAAVPLEYLRYGRGWQRSASLAALVALPLACLGWLALTFAPQRQIFKAENLYWPQLRDAEETAVKVDKKVVTPILDDPNQRHPPAEVKRFKTLLEQGRQKTHAAADLLENAGTFTDPEFVRVLENSKQYLEAWATLFELVERSLRKDGTLAFQDRKTVRAQRKRVVELNARLRGEPKYLWSGYGFEPPSK